MISRANYPIGAKHLVPLLELCLPGLDVNDPIKTMSTAMFVIQAVTSVMIDDLTRPELQDSSSAFSSYDGMEVDSDIPTEGSEFDGESGGAVPMITIDDGGNEIRVLSKKEVDAAVRESTAGFPDWVSNFFRQVLVVFEALPEPGKGNRNGGKMEDQMTQTLVVSCSPLTIILRVIFFLIILLFIFRLLAISSVLNFHHLCSI